MLAKPSSALKLKRQFQQMASLLFGIILSDVSFTFKSELSIETVDTATFVASFGAAHLVGKDDAINFPSFDSNHYRSFRFKGLTTHTCCIDFPSFDFIHSRSFGIELSDNTHILVRVVR